MSWVQILPGARLARFQASPSWELLRFGLFKDLPHEEARSKLDAWCRRQRIAAEFELRKVRDADVVFVILRAESS